MPATGDYNTLTPLTMEAKKTFKADLRRKSGMFFNLGLLISIALTLFAFEYKTHGLGEVKDFGPMHDNFEGIEDIPITVQRTPPPPPVEQPVIKEVENSEEIENTVEFVLDVEIPTPTPVVNVMIENAPIVDQADEVFELVESMPTPAGGLAGWSSYLSKNLKYPSQARRMGIEGTTYLTFIVNTDGSIQDVKVVRGIGGGCDEEAVRVVSGAPNWEPGKQRGRPVRVKMSVPIRFKLN